MKSILNLDTNILLFPYKTDDYIIEFDDSVVDLHDKIFASDKSILLSEYISLDIKGTTINGYRNLFFSDKISINVLLANNINNSFIDKIYNELTKYTLLTKSGLERMMKYILWISFPVMYSEYSYEMTDFLDNSDSFRNELIEKYKIKNINISDKILRDYIDLYINKVNETEFKYSISSCIINIKIKQENKALNLLKIIRQYKLDYIVPVMYITNDKTNSNSKEKQVVKFFKPIQEKVKEWIMKKNDPLIKQSKGLSFKLKFIQKNLKLKETRVHAITKHKCLDNLSTAIKTQSSNEKISDNTGNDSCYFNASISKDSPKITLRCNWDKSKFISYDDIFKSIVYIKKVVSNISDIMKDPNIKIIEETVSFINLSIIIKKKVELLELIFTIKSQFKNIFEIKSSSDLVLKIVYIPESVNIIIHSGDIVYIENNKKIIKKMNQISINGIKKKNQIQKIIKIIIHLFISSKSKSIKKE